LAGEFNKIPKLGPVGDVSPRHGGGCVALCDPRKPRYWIRKRVGVGAGELGMTEEIRSKAPSRRGVLGAAGVMSLAAAGGATGAVAPTPKASTAADPAWFQAALGRFAGVGDKASGGAGDVGSGDWLRQELSRLGYACSRQPFDTPYFDVREASLTCGATRRKSLHRRGSWPQGLTASRRRCDAPTPPT